MTEKRFKLGVDEQYSAILDNDKIMRKNEIVELLNALYEEKDYWKKRCLLVENKYGELPSKVKLKDIIGLVKTDEPTNSVKLKKELYK